MRPRTIVPIGVLAVFAAGLAACGQAVSARKRRLERARTRATLDDLDRWVNGLLLRFAPGACLLAASNEGAGFLQLAVTGREAEWRRVEFGLPDAAWSRERFALAAITLEEGAADARVEHDPGNARIPRFLRITLTGERTDVAARATDLLRRAAVVLSFPPGGTYTMSVTGRDHPEYYRQVARDAEAADLPRWLSRRVRALLNDHAEALERG
jgi:hypothetical protein